MPQRAVLRIAARVQASSSRYSSSTRFAPLRRLRNRPAPGTDRRPAAGCAASDRRHACRRCCRCRSPARQAPHRAACLFTPFQRIVAFRFQGFHLFNRVAEDKDVLLAHLLSDFHVSAIQRPDGQRAVQRQLHVAGARGFFTRGGDLLGDIRRRDQFSAADAQ